MDKLKTLALSKMKGQCFSYLAVGQIDFSKNSFEHFILLEDEDISKDKIYFDLASLTKPFTLAASYHLKPDLFSDEMMLLLEHRSGLPSWGRLDKSTWREQLLAYNIKESETDYSDFGALRLMLEIERTSGQDLRSLCDSFWDKEILPWQDLDSSFHTPRTGVRDGQEVRGVVNDDNAHSIGEFTSHAGLFGTIEGVCKSLLCLQEKSEFISSVDQRVAKFPSQRFIYGWDRALDIDKTLAGRGCGPSTFGHLGFTGTSIWIDPALKRGIVILSNATELYWYEKSGLNELRRELGTLVWSY